MAVLTPRLRLPEPPPGLEAKADRILSDLAAALAPIQASYLGAHGRYWQGLRSHAALPADGNGEAPDLSRKPTDQTESWQDVRVPLPAAMVIATQVDVYDGPLGRGYIVAGELEIVGRRWRRAIGVGPEARSHDWEQMQSGDAP